MRLLLWVKDNWPYYEMHTGGAYLLFSSVIPVDWESYVYHTAVFDEKHRRTGGWAAMEDMPGNG